MIMPILLNERDTISEASGLASVLIVPCRFCPAATAAVRNNAPYIELFRHGLATASYERQIQRIKNKFEAEGLKADVFRSRMPHQFVLCMWTSRRRGQLAELARKYDAVVVLGCEAAVESVRESVKSTACKVIKGMAAEGIMSIRPTFSLPCNISLELESVEPVVEA
jgi:hypothetical protein